MNNYPTYKSVINRFSQAEDGIKGYFKGLDNLIANNQWNVSLAWSFVMIEKAHISALYFGVVRVFRVDPELAWTAIINSDLTMKDFVDYCNPVFGHDLPAKIKGMLVEIRQVRNTVMHGIDVPEKDMRNCVGTVIDYAEEINKFLEQRAGFKIFKANWIGLLGGKVERLDKNRSKFLLKGLGFTLS